MTIGDAGPYRVGVSTYALSDVDGAPGGELGDFTVAGTGLPSASPSASVPFEWTTARLASSEVRVTTATGQTGVEPMNPWGVGQIVRASKVTAQGSGGDHEQTHTSDIFMLNGAQLLHNSNGLGLVNCSLKAGLGTCSNWTSTDLPPIVAAGILATATVDTNDTSHARLTVFTMDMNPPTAPLPHPQGTATYCINGCVKSGGWIRILRSYSLDSGQSWTTEPHAVWSHQFKGHGTIWNPNGTIAGPAGGDFVSVLPSQIMQLRNTNGSKLLFLFEVDTLATESGFSGAGGSFLEQPPPGGAMYSLMSADLSGISWSGLANLDGPPYLTTAPTTVDVSPVLWVAEARGQFGSEIAAVELSDGRVLAFIRPHYSPFMIEALSASPRPPGGAIQWTPLSKGHFSMYACGTAAVMTESGVILVGGRLPGQGLQVSWDNGISFQTFQVDTTGHGQGSMAEVAPNVVLFVYGGPHLRQQLIRVSAEQREISPLTKLETDQLMNAFPVSSTKPVSSATAAGSVNSDTVGDHDGDGGASDWEFLGGAWNVSSEDNGFALTAPNNNEDNFAFYRPSSGSGAFQGSWRARFEYQWQYFFTTAGFIFGAQNTSSFFQLDFPWNSGGPMDAKPEYVYASLSRVQDTSGWREQGQLQLLHGVSCNPQLWHSVALRLDVNASAAAEESSAVLTVTVDDRTQVRFAFPAHWPAPVSGFVGVATYSTLGKEKRARFRSFHAEGEAHLLDTDQARTPAHSQHALTAVRSVPRAATVDQIKGQRLSAAAKVDAAFDPTGVGNIVEMARTLFTTNCGGAPMQCYLLRAPLPSNESTTMMPSWSRDPTSLPQSWVTPATDHGVSLRATAQQLEAYFVQLPTAVTTAAGTQQVFRVGRATSRDGRAWTEPTTVWSSAGARMPPPPPNTAALDLRNFTALASCQLLERHHTRTGSVYDIYIRI